jgi:hypothetical protein
MRTFALAPAVLALVAGPVAASDKDASGWRITGRSWAEN